jgi:hypothetical protein
MIPGKLDFLLDAMDELYQGTQLVELIGMTARHSPTAEQKALSVGVRAALDRLEAAHSMLKELQDREGRA